MRRTATLLLAGLLSTTATTLLAQNQITTPAGQPLTIGLNGVRHASLNSASATQASNGKVLSLDATGTFILVPDVSGAPSQWTTAGSNVHYNLGNVGLGVTNPLQRLDVNGDINIPTTGAIRVGNVNVLRFANSSTLVGTNAGAANTAVGSVFVGHEAGYSNTTGANNAVVGYQAGRNITTGSRNTTFGYQAIMGVAGNVTGDDNSAFGYRAGYSNTTGYNNFFMGSRAGELNTTGFNNLFLGGLNGRNTTTGSRNTFIGTSTAAFNTTGFQNTFVGELSGYANTTGSRNSYLGRASGFNSTTGEYNTYVGHESGINDITGSFNTFVGERSGPTSGATNLQYATAIGRMAQVSCDNCLVLGRASVQTNVGIGTTSPATKLHVVAGGTTATGVRLQGLPTVSGTVFRLYVDVDGNVMRASSSGLRESAEGLADRNWTLTPDNHLLNTNSGGIMIGTGLDRTPAGYSLYVANGILTERVKVALKSTDEWRDNVFQPDYKLRSIEEVAQHIEQHKHLPGVPSAEEMVANGNDLQKTDALLLEKIEEMMLYIIELKKRISVLENSQK